MSKKNYIIRQFDPKIYPRLLWVSVGAPIEALREMFGENFPDIDEDAIADTYRVKVMKPKERAGLLIRFRSKNDITFENVTHEAGHAALEIFNYCECAITADNQEPFTYLSGWIAKCCGLVKANKKEDD